MILGFSGDDSKRKTLHKRYFKCNYRKRLKIEVL